MKKANENGGRRDMVEHKIIIRHGSFSDSIVAECGNVIVNARQNGKWTSLWKTGNFAQSHVCISGDHLEQLKGLMPKGYKACRLYMEMVR